MSYYRMKTYPQFWDKMSWSLCHSEMRGMEEYQCVSNVCDACCRSYMYV